MELLFGNDTSIAGWGRKSPPLNASLLSPAPSPAPAPGPWSAVNETAPEVPDTAEEEVFASVSILIQILMLGLAFVVGHILRRRKIYYIHEASASLMIGLVVGFVGNLYSTQESFRKWLNFKEEFFLLFLLPPIIFESGFSLQVRPFFNNFGAIVVFSCLGTFIAAMVTGTLVYIAGLLFLVFRLSFLESLLFGSLISSTDPVTVLAIFQELGADTNLHALVFGESVLNDAVAITMFRTIMSIVLDPTDSPRMSAVFKYALVTLLGSASIGMAVALICALLFKYAGLSVSRLHNLECCLIVLFPYISYMVAEGLALSGIVAILFCGVAMKRYAVPNLSDMAQTLAAGFFQIIASLAETFTFIYMGTEIALGEAQSWGHLSFIVFSILIICFARAANVFPCSHLVNMFRPPSKQIPERHQKALWCSGLRGAMAFALALQCVKDLPNESHARTIYTATIVIVMLTVILLGGSTATILEQLDVLGGDRQKRNTDETDDEDEERRPLKLIDDSSVSSLAMDKVQRRQASFQESASFESLDLHYIRPFFTSMKDESDS